MRYREAAPSPRLRPWVRSYWQLRAAAPRHGALPVRGLPDGRADVLYDLGDPQDLIPGAARSAARLVGLLGTAATCVFAGRVDLFGISFRPGAARAFFGLPMYELSDGHAELAHAPCRAAFPTAEVLCAASSFRARVRVAEAALARAPRPVADAAVLHAAEILEAAGGRATVAELCAATGYGERRLQRRFRAEVGVAPQQLAGIVRFGRAKDLLRAAGPGAMAGLALRVGYYDQAQLSREFKRFAGMTPTAWLAECSARPRGPVHEAV